MTFPDAIIPESVRAIIADCATKHPTPDLATKEAERRILKEADYKQFAALLVRHAIRELVYDVRHRANIEIRRDAGQYGGPAKVTSGANEAVNRVAAGCYFYCIAGKLLGDIMGGELTTIAEDQAEKASGFLFNVALCKRLAKLVPSDKRVKDAVSEKKLSQVFAELQNKFGNAASPRVQPM